MSRRATDEEIDAAVEAYREHGSYRKAGEALGVHNTTILGRLAAAKRRVPPVADDWQRDEPAAEFPEIPSAEPSYEQLKSRKIADFQLLDANRKAAALIKVKVKIEGPFGIMAMGDPHVDADGCDWPTLDRHTQLIRRTEGLFGSNVGDLTNNWVGRLARLYGQQNMSRTRALIMAEGWLREVNWLWIDPGNHDCLDPDTEALTKRGWTQYHDIRDDDEVLSLNRETGACEWHPILQKFSRENDEEMVSIETVTVSLSATPSHRVLSKKYNNWSRSWSGFEYRKASELPATFALPTSAPSSSPGVALSDDELTLCGWVLTDGSVREGKGTVQVAIFQSKPCPDLEAVIERLGLKCTMRVRDRSDITEICGRKLLKAPLLQREYHFDHVASRRIQALVESKGQLPSWAWLCDDRQFGVLLDAMIAGDGCWDGSDPSAKKCAVLHKDKAFLDSVQACAVAHGWRANLSLAREKDWRLNLSKNTEWQAHRRMVVKRTEAAPWVWCLTVPLGNFMMRRNGKAHFTGNCWSGADDPIKWITRFSGIHYKWQGSRLELVPPSGQSVVVNSRHDHPGFSMYHPTHGPLKASIWDGHADDIYTCGHIHTGGYMLRVDPRGRASHILRLSSYKVYDDHADERGFRSAHLPAGVFIINPHATDRMGRVMFFADPEHGADMLTHMRRMHAEGRRIAA